MEDINSSQQRVEALKRNGHVLSKYLRLLLWFEIPRLIGILMTSGLVNPISYVQLDAGHLIMLGATIGYVFCLLKLSGVSDRYKYVAWISIALELIKWIPTFVLDPLRGYMFQYIALWLTYLLNAWGIYLELNAHMDALYRVDVVLSEKWHDLSVLFLILYGVQFACEILYGDIALLRMIAEVGMWIVPIALLVTNVLKLIYLYKTAKLFRDSVAQLQN